jgi:hypothetical protein
MGKLIEETISDFSGGMTNDLRGADKRFAALIKHFDIYSKKSLIPYRSTESGSSGGDTDKLAQFLYYNGKAFALGVVTGNNRVKIFENSDLSADTWSATTNGADSGGTRNEDVFIEYKGNAYGWRTGAAAVWQADLSGSVAFDNAEVSQAFTNVAQGLAHSKDDMLYLPYDNKIMRNNAGSWTNPVLTLPSNLIITAICEYGNYLAIACKSSNGVDKSRIFLWDRDSSLTTLSESIDGGTGDIVAMEEVEGFLLTVTLVGSNANFFKAKLVIRAWEGGSASKIIREIEATTTVSAQTVHKQKVNNRFLFSISGFQLGGSTHNGVWCVSRTPAGFAVSLDRLPNNDTALTTGAIKGFRQIGDYFLTAYLSNSAYAVSKTIDSATFSATSIYESKVFDGSDPSLYKDLVGITVTHEPLLTAGSVVVKYKTDAQSSFSSAILTNTTDDSISASINSGSGSLPKDWKEIQFRIESTGGAVITGFSFQVEVTGKRVYDAVE